MSIVTTSDVMIKIPVSNLVWVLDTLICKVTCFDSGSDKGKEVLLVSESWSYKSSVIYLTKVGSRNTVVIYPLIVCFEIKWK